MRDRPIGCAHWSYAAAVAEGMCRKAMASSTKTSDYPRGVFLDLQNNFFALLLEAQSEQPTKHGLNSISLSYLACVALGAIDPDAVSTQARCNDTISTFAKLHAKFAADWAPNAEERESLGKLAEFFLWIRDRGESEAFDRRMNGPRDSQDISLVA